MPDIPVASLLGLQVPNVLPQSIFGLDVDWMRPAGRLIWSSALLVGGAAAGFFMTRRPRSPEPSTWAQSILGATLVWAWMLLAYGVVPHEWLNFGASYLDFARDTFALYENRLLPIDVDRQAIVHAGVAGMYVVFTAVQVWLFARWQKRPVAEVTESPESAEPTGEEGGPKAPWYRRRPARVSAFGRPVTRET